MKIQPKPKIGGTHVVKLWKEDVANLKDTLRIYGRHQVGCGKSSPGPPGDCECGWLKIAIDLKLRPVRNVGHYPL